jgi:N-acetylglucosamine repressor
MSSETAVEALPRRWSTGSVGVPPAHKVQPNLLRQMNERRVFDLVRCWGPASRADLRRHMGVSAPTVSKAVAHLVDAGLLEKVGTAPARRGGRPVVVYRLARGSVQVLGATIGVRRCVVAAASLDGTIDHDSMLSFPMPATYDELINQFESAARKLMDRKGITTLGIGLTAPGEVDARAGRVLLCPNVHILDGQSPGADLQRRLGVDVRLVHDTTAVALADQHYGPAAEMRDFVRMGVFEGFGVSVISGGRPVEGKRGLAGELGHITVDLDGEICGCGNRGCLETVATDAAFVRAISRRIGEPLDPEDALPRMTRGEIDPQPELDRSLNWLSVGVSAAINLFNPQAVLVCSRMFDVDAGAFDRLKEMTARRALGPLMDDCRILRANTVGPLGAVAAIIYHLTNSLGPLVD